MWQTRPVCSHAVDTRYRADRNHSLVRSLVAPDVSQEVDRVISRAMAKDPDFRFPSAGDFGRAALAAATGTTVAEPEHTVATGEAAPATEPAPPPAVSESTIEGAEVRPTAPPSTVEASAAQPTAPSSEPPDESPTAAAAPSKPRRPARAGGRRRLAALAGVLAVGAAVAVGIIALTGGGGGDAKSSSATGGGGGSKTSPDNGGGGQSGNALDDIKFETFSANGFTVDVPKGWATVAEEISIGENVTWTALASPDDQMNVQVQYTGPEPPTEAAEGARDERQRDDRYQELTFEETTVGGRDAVLYGYVHSEPEAHGLPAIPETTVFNYYFEDGGFAWRTRAAVSTSEPDSANLAKGIAT